MDWVLIYNRVMRFGMQYTEGLIPIQLALILASLAVVIITIIKDKKSRWLASSLAVMIEQLFLSMHTYSNLFNVVFRRKAIYKNWYIGSVFKKTQMESRYLVCVVLLLDIAFIVCFCMHFIRNYHIGVIHLIAALAASVGTRITGYISTITPPTFAFYVFDRRSGDSGMLPTIVSAQPLPFNERIAYLNTAPKIIGIVLTVILFASLITCSLRIKTDHKRNKLYVFPSLILISELIRYVTIATCDRYFERITDLKFGLINMIACIICLAWAVFLFKTRSKLHE